MIDSSKQTALLEAHHSMVEEHETARRVSRSKYFENESPELQEIRIRLDILLPVVTNTGLGNANEVSEEFSYQVSLIASFIRTHHVINNLVVESDLIEATTLIRKQIESVTRLIELDSKKVKSLEGKTPNVGNKIDSKLADYYSQFSAVAHFGRAAVSQLLPSTPGVVPQELITTSVFQSKSYEIYVFHMLTTSRFLAWFIEKRQKLNPGFKDINHLKQWIKIQEIAIEAGFIERKT